MSKTLRLLVTTPNTVVLDLPGVVAVRGEDASGSFGLLPGHCEFMTALAVSVLSFRDQEGRTRYVAVRGGVLTMRDGTVVEIATRDAVVGDELENLRGLVLKRMELDAEAEALARTQTMRMQVAVMRTLHRYLRGERLPVLPFGQTLGGDGHG
ncbi:ATP synthase epsilon chain 2 [Azospirillaceae bacterium]